MRTEISIITESFDVKEVNTVAELFLSRSQLRTIMSGYEELKLDTPEWVIDRVETIEREINLRVNSDLQLRLRQAKARRASLLTNEEKRASLDSEISMLEGRIKN